MQIFLRWCSLEFEVAQHCNNVWLHRLLNKLAISIGKAANEVIYPSLFSQTTFLFESVHLQQLCFILKMLKKRYVWEISIKSSYWHLRTCAKEGQRNDVDSVSHCSSHILIKTLKKLAKLSFTFAFWRLRNFTEFWIHQSSSRRYIWTMGIIESIMDSKYELSDFRKKKLLHEFRCFYGEYNHFSGDISSSYVEINMGRKRKIQLIFHAMTMTKSDNRFVEMEMTSRLLGYLIFRETLQLVNRQHKTILLFLGS